MKRGLWRQEWRGKHGGHSFFGVVERLTTVNTWGWSLQVDRRAPVVGGARTFREAVKALQVAADRVLKAKAPRGAA